MKALKKVIYIFLIIAFISLTTWGILKLFYNESSLFWIKVPLAISMGAFAIVAVIVLIINIIEHAKY